MKVNSSTLVLSSVILFVLVLGVVSFSYRETARGLASLPITPQGDDGIPLELPLASASGTTYVYGKALIASKDCDRSLTYHVQDFLSSNRLTTDDEGLMQSKFLSYPYGKILTKQSFSSGVQKYTFTGKEDDGNLMYFGARYMDARTGRFVSVDPIPRTYNNYEYGKANPLRFTDPTGMEENDNLYTHAQPDALQVGRAPGGENIPLGEWLRQGRHEIGLAASIGVGLIPGIGECYDCACLACGMDIFARDRFTALDYAATGIGLASIAGSGTVARLIARNADELRVIARNADEIVEESADAVRTYSTNRIYDEVDRAAGIDYSRGPGRSEVFIDVRGNAVDSDGNLYSGSAIWIVDRTGELRFGSSKIGDELRPRISHAQLASGEELQGAGTAIFNRGIMTETVRTNTGHYHRKTAQFNIDSFKVFDRAMENSNIRTNRLLRYDVSRILSE